jgi:alpha-glucosidase
MLKRRNFLRESGLPGPQPIYRINRFCGEAVNLIQKVVMGLRRVGLTNTLRIVQFTLYKEREDRKWAVNQSARGISLSPGELRSVQPAAGGALFTFERAELEVIFLAEDLARLSWGPGEGPLPYSLARTEWPEVQFQIAQTGQSWSLWSSSLKVEVSSNAEVRFYDPEGRLLRAEDPPERRGEAWTQRACLEPGARPFGLGQRAGWIKQDGRPYRLWNRDPVNERGMAEHLDPLYLAIPVYLAAWEGGSYLVFFENYFPGSLSFQNGWAKATFEGGRLRSYLIPGPPQRALERYTELTGRAPLPPRWALGYHQSHWGYKSEADIRQVAAGFKEHALPLSAIHLDIDYTDGYRVFTVDRKRFPDLPGLAGELAEQGIRLVAILDPGVKKDPGYFLYREGLEKGYFCSMPDGREALGVVWPGWCVFPDFTNPAVREWWAGQYPRLLELGIAGFWHDMNEPATIAAWGDFTLPLAARHHLEGRGGDHREAHNLYGLLMNAAGDAGLRQARPDSRPWLLSRSGWAGVQRCAWNWTGDSDAAWEDLRSTLATVLGLGLSGVPYSGADIGGFGGRPSAELYLRWFQLSAFLPFFRTHSAVEYGRREPWIYGEPYTSILREFLLLRGRLLPYLYTLAWETSRTGQPLARPLFWDEPFNPTLLEVEDTFLLGNSLLVAPVLEEGERERSVALPDGEWYDFWTGDRLVGPGQVQMDAPLERIPLLVRAGSALPTEELGRLVLHLFAGSGEGLLYSDAGDGYGPHRVDRFRLEGSEHSLELAWDWEGEYPFPYPRIEIRLHGLRPERAWLDGQPAVFEAGLLTAAPFKRLRIEGRR